MRKVNIAIWQTDAADLAIPQRKKWFNYDGVFHQWGINYEEFDTGPGNYTIAIVELADGTVVEVLPSRVKFLDSPTTA